MYHLRSKQIRFMHTLLRLGCVQFIQLLHLSALHPEQDPHLFLCALFPAGHDK